MTREFENKSAELPVNFPGSGLPFNEVIGRAEIERPYIHIQIPDGKIMDQVWDVMSEHRLLAVSFTHIPKRPMEYKDATRDLSQIISCITSGKSWSMPKQADVDMAKKVEAFIEGTFR